MKMLVAMMTVFLSMNAFSGVNDASEEQNDSQELIRAGKLSDFLRMKIKDIKAEDSSLSDQEALDSLLAKYENK